MSDRVGWTGNDDIYVDVSDPDDPAMRSDVQPEDARSNFEHAPHIRLDIQGLRAVAVGAVVIYHATTLLPGGFVGVDVFFVISGYVIAGVLRRSMESSPTPLRDFYGRRVRRLMPPAAMMVAVTLVVGLFVVPFSLHAIMAKAAVASTLLSSNIWFALSASNYFDGGAVNNPFLHTWSLGVEEQFYLVVPLLYALLYKADRRWSRSRLRLLPVVLGLIGIVSFILCVIASSRSTQIEIERFYPRWSDIAFYSSPTRAWEFLAGFLLSGVVLRAGRNAVLVLKAIAWIALGSFFLLYSDSMAFPGWWAIGPVLATMGLLLVGAAGGGSSKVLSSRPMVFVGDRSYGIYLWHWPALVLFRFTFVDSLLAVPLALTSTLVLTMLSYRLLETPLRSVSKARTTRNVGLAGLCCVVPVIAAGCLLALSPRLALARGATLSDTANSLTVPPGISRDECLQSGAYREWDRALCTSSVGGSPSVFLVGDSHASAVAGTVAEAALEAGLGFQVWTRAGCPFSAATTVDESGCADWQAGALELLLQERPGLVVIANRSPVYARAPGQSRDVEMVGQPVAQTEDEALAVWSQGLRSVVGPLVEADIPVLLVSTVPEFPVNPRYRVSFLHPTGDLEPISVEDVASRRGKVVDVERAIVASTPHVREFDPVPYLCAPVCRQFDGAAWRYRDDDHLTQLGAQLLKGPLRSAIQESVAGASLS